MSDNCLIITQQIKSLTNQLIGETQQSVLGLVSMWQTDNNRPEEYPTVEELKSLIAKRNTSTSESLGIQKENEGNKEVSPEETTEILINERASDVPKVTLQELQQIDIDFDPITRRNRVMTLARLFSTELDYALQEELEKLREREKYAEGKEKETLNDAIKKATRISVLRSITPAKFFERILDMYKEYVETPKEDLIAEELDVINSSKGAENLTEEQKARLAEKNVNHFITSYNKIIKNFKVLVEEACPIINKLERIKLDPYAINEVKQEEFAEEYNEGEEEYQDPDDEGSKKETAKEGWMTNFRETSVHDSMSQEVRRAIMLVPRLNNKGFAEKDDLGMPIFLDGDYVTAVLLDKLQGMTSSEEMMPMLEELSIKLPWVRQLVKLLKNDPKLFTQFYTVFRKDFTNFWVQKKSIKADGTFKYETIAINKPEGVYYLLDSWRDNHIYGKLLDEDSVYDVKGDFNIENIKKGLDLVTKLQNTFNNLEVQESIEKLEDVETFSEILKVLHMLGIDVDSPTIKIALSNVPQIKGAKVQAPIKQLLQSLNVIYKGLNDKGASLNAEEIEDSEETKIDLINTYGSAFNNIAQIFSKVTDDAIESSVAETIDGKTKTYYGHTNPNYLGKIIKRLKGYAGNPEKFAKFIQEEFRQYEWFFKNGKWRNDIIAQLVESEEVRKGLDHKVNLATDRVSYSKLDGLSYLITILNEYWSIPVNKSSNKQWAYYYVPILADAPSGEFIKFLRYTNNTVKDANGKYLTYQEQILPKLANLIMQEYDRIMMVRERDKILHTENSTIKHIANFDIIRDKEGNITNIGGAEFKFLPVLNNYKTSDDKTFLEVMENLVAENKGVELQEFLNATILDIMENGFEEEYLTYTNLGLFEESENGGYLHIPFKGQSGKNAVTVKVLNSAKEKLGNLWTSQMKYLTSALHRNLPIKDKEASDIFNSIKTALDSLVQEGKLDRKDANNISVRLKVDNNAKEALKEYYWNNKLFESQFIQITTTDLAFYANLEDFQKRFKEIHAPSVRLNTRAEYNGEIVGREFEKTIYLADEEITSSVVEDIKEVILEKYSKGELTEYNAASILSKFGYSNHTLDGKKYTKIGKTMVKTSAVNVADAQAYRSLSSYRAMMVMAGKWTDDMEKAYNNLNNNNWSFEDFNIIWQTVKPFVYTQVNTRSGVTGHSGIKTPVQHKNSEFLLLAMYNIIAAKSGKSSKLKAINEFMEENGIDVVQFESAVKVGKQAPIDISHISSVNNIKEYLGRATGIAYSNINPDVIHTVPYEDYGIQTETPEHGIDAVQLVGTQLRKLITADMPEGTRIIIGNKSMTKEEWLKVYNEINTENILYSFKEVDKIFSDKKEVEKILLDTMRGNPRYGTEMIRACTLGEDGNFNLPLYDPVISQKIQSLLNSVIRSRITKQKTRGGAFIQTAAYGYNDDLKIVFEGEGKNKRIKYMECYMPAYSKEFYEPLMDSKTGQLDINKLPEDLRKLVGYRVPTEDAYSMAPLYIKGFLPQQNGSAIMLPADITTIAGSDFDVDKLYVMLPEFKIEKYDKMHAKKDFEATQNIAEQADDLVGVLMSVLDETFDYEDLDKNVKFKEWFEENKEKYLLSSPKISKIKYDFSKPTKHPKNDNSKARNNALIDMIWGVLTNEATAVKMLNPGGFDNLKAVDRIITLLKNVDKRSLMRQLQITDPSKLIYTLEAMDVKTLTDLAKKFKVVRDPLAASTQVYFHQQNMTGGTMIGIYANHNANHALMQHIAVLELDKKEGSFTLNGERFTKLNAIKNKKGEFISRNTASFLAASVDNVKDTVLAGLNQNTFTADATMLLIRLGYSPLEVGLLMNQPIIEDIITEYFRNVGKGLSKEDIIDSVIKKYNKKNLNPGNILVNKDFTIEELTENIMNASEMTSIESIYNTKDHSKIEFYNRQVAIGYLFMRIMKSADALSQLVGATRADTGNGGTGSNIAETITKIQKTQDFLRDASEAKFPIKGANTILRDNIDLTLDEDKLREEILNSPLPFLQAFYTLGLKSSERFLKDYFPFYNDTFNETIKFIKENLTKNGKISNKTMNNVYNDLLAYIMSNLEFFGTNEDSSAEERRAYFINEFPAEFKRVIEENPDIANIEFIKRLKFARANRNNPVDTIVFKNVGHLTDILRERYTRDWTFLLHSSNPEAQKLALNLFRYCYYRNGFAFGPNTFIHLSSTALRKAIPDYVTTLEKIFKDTSVYYEFVEQFVYNHLDDRSLVPEIPDKATVSFEDENKEIRDFITVKLYKDSNSADKKFAKEITKDTVVFRPYIGKRMKGKLFYYVLEGDKGGVATYRRIEPLGLKGNFLEYEFGKDVSMMTSVVGRGNKDEILAFKDRVATERALQSLDEEFVETPIEDYESFATDHQESFEVEALNEAYGIVFGEKSFEPLEVSEIPEAFTGEPLTEEWRDEDGEIICGKKGYSQENVLTSL